MDISRVTLERYLRLEVQWFADKRQAQCAVPERFKVGQVERGKDGVHIGRKDNAVLALGAEVEIPGDLQIVDCPREGEIRFAERKAAFLENKFTEFSACVEIKGNMTVEEADLRNKALEFVQIDIMCVK